ncbi:MAG TPA: glutaminase A [Candidatus Limnocylindrales bacterium]|jgi:glutaminase|nr:glutaminase A [Candidatus Limnocylindrales bacterium]
MNWRHVGPFRIGLVTSSVFAVLLSVAAQAQTGLPSGQTLEGLAKEAHAKFKEDNSGKNADYIPALAKVPSHLFGLTIVTVDGKVISVGDVDYSFSMQSCSKVFTMCLVMQESGDKAIYEKVSVEPTGERFNSIVAIEEGDGRADNPFVNPGAIATVSLVKATSAQDRWDKIIGCYNKFAGEKLSVLDDIYKSEAETNFRNRGIAHILYNSGHLYAEPLECTDVYTKQCSVGVTCKQLAVMGSVLANHGINPVTKERCLEAKYVPKVLAVMTIAGFYDGSGAWAWNAGLPAKTGVGGGIVAVVPGRMAIAGFAPPLDKFGNSVRAQEAIRYLAEQLDLSIFGSSK